MDRYRVFLTGNPGSGKTTVISKVSEELRTLGIRVGGVISQEIRHNGMRVGFSLLDLLTSESGILAHINQKDGPRVGKYRVNLVDLERIAAKSILRAVQEADVVVIDEIGPMELNSLPFINAIEFAWASPKSILGTIHRNATHALVTKIRSEPDCELLLVDPSSRDQLHTTITENLVAHRN